MPMLTDEQLLDNLIDSIDHKTRDDDQEPDEEQRQALQQLRRELAAMSRESRTLIALAVELGFGGQCECGLQWHVDGKGDITESSKAAE